MEIQKSEFLRTDLGVDFSKIERLLLGQFTFDFHMPTNMKFSLVCEIIGWFGNLKHLTFVAEDYMSIPADEELVVTDLVNFDTTLRIYEGGYTPEKDRNLRGYESNCTLQALRKLEAEKAGIIAKRDKAYQGGSVGYALGYAGD